MSKKDALVNKIFTYASLPLPEIFSNILTWTHDLQGLPNYIFKKEIIILLIYYYNSFLIVINNFKKEVQYLSLETNLMLVI